MNLLKIDTGIKLGRRHAIVSRNSDISQIKRENLIDADLLVSILNNKNKRQLIDVDAFASILSNGKRSDFDDMGLKVVKRDGGSLIDADATISALSNIGKRHLISRDHKMRRVARNSNF